MKENRETAAFVGGIYPATPQYAPLTKSPLQQKCEPYEFSLCGKMSVSPKGPLATPTAVIQPTSSLLSSIVSILSFYILNMNDFLPPRYSETVGRGDSRIMTPVSHRTTDGFLCACVHVHLCAY